MQGSKISLDGGFTCPNVDGTVATGGCTFCDNRAFSPSRRVRRDAITNQIERGITGLKRRYSTEKFLAYFQPATNTYGPLDKLRLLWKQPRGSTRRRAGYWNSTRLYS